MSKKIDENGFWYIPHNPISKEGVFDYLGSSISDECEPNKIYKVYRPAATLRDSVPTWDNPPKPFINDHEMLGEGFSEIDSRPVQGIIYNPTFDEKTGVLYADIAVYSESLKEQIEQGKKELSLGYFCKYIKQRGVFKGIAYDYVQTEMSGNHIALVDAGRCGSDVKVFDAKCVYDHLDVQPAQKNLDTTWFQEHMRAMGFDETEIQNSIAKALKDTELEKPLKVFQKNETITVKPVETQTKGTTMAKYILLEDVKKILKDGMQWKDGEESPTQKLMVELVEKAAVEATPTTTASDEDETEEKKECGDEDEEEKKDADIQKVMDAIAALSEKVQKIMDSEEKKSESEEKESEDEDDDEESETEDEDEDEKSDSKKSEDEDEDEEETEDEDEDDEDGKKSAGDSVGFVFGRIAAIDEDEAIKDYLK